MTRQQIRWARQHDWFVMAVEPVPGEFDGGKVVALDWDGKEEKHVDFTDFAELRAWAGY